MSAKDKANTDKNIGWHENTHTNFNRKEYLSSAVWKQASLHYNVTCWIWHVCTNN